MKIISVYLCIVFMFILTMTGCSNRVVENKIEKTNIVPSGLSEEMGEGEFVINTPNKNKDISVVFIDEFKTLVQLGFESKEFDNSRSSYIYIDGKLNTIEKLGQANTITLTVDEDNLSSGIHKVEVVQFDNDKTNGTPITYKTGNYEVKIK